MRIPPHPQPPASLRAAARAQALRGAAAAVRGAAAERRAARTLQAAGFTILERNYRCRAGELDIVARRGRLLVIAEVRLRAGHAFGGAAGSITAAKRRRLWIAARHLLARRPWLARLTVRFDALLARSPAGPIEWLEAVM